MFSTVQGLLDCLKAKPIWLFPMLLWGMQAAYSQDKYETPKQTNAKIFQLAEASQLHPVDIPIGAGDVLHVDVFDVPELSRDVRVGETGDITLPLIPGRIHTAGLTPFELEAKLEALLIENGLVSHPQVSVFVKEQNSQPVSVVGAVARPMVYQIIRPTTLLEILAAAGGIADDAGSNVLVTRGASSPAPDTGSAKPTTPDGQTPKGGGEDPAPNSGQTISIRLQELLVSGDPTFNIPVYGGDVVSVPRSGIVYVTGAVQAPGGYVLESRGDKITVMKAMTMAHGLTGTAKSNSAVILRVNATTGAKEEIPAPIKKILARKIDDIPLQPNDILYIPDSTGKKVLYRSGEAVVQLGTGVVLFRSTR